MVGWHAFSVSGCPIRKSLGQRSFAPHQGLSQLITSFIARKSQGIRHAPFPTFSRRPYFLIMHNSQCTMHNVLCTTVNFVLVHNPFVRRSLYFRLKFCRASILRFRTDGFFTIYLRLFVYTFSYACFQYVIDRLLLFFCVGA